jgi:hypothetical protein
VKRTTIILLALLGGGCAAAHPAAPVAKTTRQPADTVQFADYKPSPASALCFASPVAPSFALPGLDRADRQPAAFLGYDQTETESYFIYTDDFQFDFSAGLGSFQRDAVYAKSGTRTR